MTRLTDERIDEILATLIDGAPSANLHRRLARAIESELARQAEPVAWRVRTKHWATPQDEEYRLVGHVDGLKKRDGWEPLYLTPPLPAAPAMTNTLVDRLNDEADLCANEGANDIAALLREAAQALAPTNRRLPADPFTDPEFADFHAAAQGPASAGVQSSGALSYPVAAAPDTVRVPREPTIAMQDAFREADGQRFGPHFQDAYRAMIAAAPKATP